MTPLAQAILNDYAEPIARRRFRDRGGILPRLMDAHCFDVAAIFDAAGDLAKDLHRRGETMRGALSFLPASKTWIEWRRGGGREGVLLEAEQGEKIALATWAYRGDGLFLSSASRGALALFGDGRIDQPYLSVRPFRGETIEEECGWLAVIYALLAMINTPRVIGRRQHMPHAGLQRKLAAARGMPGKYPLHAWHEIVLEVTPPRVDDSTPREARLTGGKALHFVRSHLRVRLGRLELVSAHWRGDPALGMKRSRYRLDLPRAA